ncbi:MAG: imidazole glycerol phosphate synthase subunit HisH [Alphaproteobacteria bacterium]|nr:imidazole glycerol phosphate synthase subunit HisH [Alphaproteobacteria bacterium]
MLITVIDYGSGNLRSATKAFEKAAADASDIRGNVRVILTNKAEDVLKADRIVLPGQGAFADCMKGLSSVPGMIEALNEAVIKKAKPFFGICVGMQLLATRGLEHGTHAGLNWLSGEVRKLPINNPDLKIPHMGWNTITPSKPNHPLLKDLPTNPYVYFVHSYALFLEDKNHELAACNYGGSFTAAVVKNNIAGTQFHPEKSQKIGQQLVRNFINWSP